MVEMMRMSVVGIAAVLVRMVMVQGAGKAVPGYSQYASTLGVG